STNGMEGEDVLKLYEKHFRNYEDSCNNLSLSCQYMHRQWKPLVFEQDRRDVYEIDKLAKQIWKETFFKPIFPNITQICLNLIKEHRINKLSIDIETIRKTIEMYADQNVNNKMKDLMENDSISEPITDIYQQCFEIKFLQDTEVFYRQQKVPSLESNSIIEYLILVNIFLFNYQV
ncbi:unnamed protein product, partial [Rotaria sp. Silwood1]